MEIDGNAIFDWEMNIKLKDKNLPFFRLQD